MHLKTQKTGRTGSNGPKCPPVENSLPGQGTHWPVISAGHKIRAATYRHATIRLATSRSAQVVLDKIVLRDKSSNATIRHCAVYTATN